MEKKEILEAMEQLSYLSQVFNTLLFCKTCDIGNKEEFLNDNLKALDLAMDALEKEYRSAIADIITVRSEYELYINYSKTDIETIKDIIATNLVKKLREDNLIDFHKIKKGMTSIGDIYTYRGEIEVIMSNRLKYIQIGKAVAEGFNKGFEEALKEAENE